MTRVSVGWTKAEYDRCPELAERLHGRILDLEDENYQLDRRRVERDHWIRLFNRLQAAVQRHKNHKHDLFVDEADEALYAAMDRVLKAAAKGVE